MQKKVEMKKNDTKKVGCVSYMWVPYMVVLLLWWHCPRAGLPGVRIFPKHTPFPPRSIQIFQCIAGRSKILFSPFPLSDPDQSDSQVQCTPLHLNVPLKFRFTISPIFNNSLESLKKTAGSEKNKMTVSRPWSAWVVCRRGYGHFIFFSDPAVFRLHFVKKFWGLL